MNSYVTHQLGTHIIISFEFRPARIERLHCYFVVLDAGACWCHIVVACMVATRRRSSKTHSCGWAAHPQPKTRGWAAHPQPKTRGSVASCTCFLQLMLCVFSRGWATHPRTGATHPRGSWCLVLLLDASAQDRINILHCYLVNTRLVLMIYHVLWQHNPAGVTSGWSKTSPRSSGKRRKVSKQAFLVRGCATIMAASALLWRS